MSQGGNQCQPAEDVERTWKAFSDGLGATKAYEFAQRPMAQRPMAQRPMTQRPMAQRPMAKDQWLKDQWRAICFAGNCWGCMNEWMNAVNASTKRAQTCMHDGLDGGT
eukprot:CAMPEP_0171576728 /NCGR_PEP_ID=MMETSP0961-20121227/6790_1 /TAXON_ID=87120 /ORGANISM="Aurantiochytrium limacinum, Strain ATCCMYA-1381" /LENGTH=107 /DNA_ID=CAMNT_0012132619 /DNA_START=423 /DNA_END=747 /DNA_ORIENTATION=-